MASRSHIEGFFVTIRKGFIFGPIRRTFVDVMVEFDGDELHFIMTSGPKRWVVRSTAGAVAGVSIQRITPSTPAPHQDPGSLELLLERPRLHPTHRGVQRSGPCHSPKQACCESGKSC
jgi:hypothetical protein